MTGALHNIEWGGGPLGFLLSIQDQAQAFCLYSGGLDRYSYAGARPCRTCKVYPGRLEIDGHVRPLSRGEDPFRILAREFSLKEGSGEGLRSGWVGHWAYEMASFADASFPRRDLPEECLLACWAYYDTIWIWDHAAGRAYRSGAEPAWAAGLRAKAPQAASNFRWKASSSIGEQAYLQALGKVLAYIAAGDCYQVNFSQRFACELPEGLRPAEEFARLALRHPAPYAAFLDCGSKQILSLSPEEFLSLDGDRLRTRPIKGTRRRGSTPAEDEAIRKELEENEKERAELLMIVDLERNDLGKVCETGSVRVLDLRRLVSYDYVHHALAIVEGKKKSEVNALEATRAMFPGGSITGAPKRRAMEIIQELESEARGVYTGAIGFYDQAGPARLSIAIRTLEIEGRRARFGMGGGIVADSDARQELQEIFVKAKVFEE